jgi:hypothetical protein
MAYQRSKQKNPRAGSDPARLDGLSISSPALAPAKMVQSVHRKNDNICSEFRKPLVAPCPRARRLRSPRRPVDPPPHPYPMDRLKRRKAAGTAQPALPCPLCCGRKPRAVRTRFGCCSSSVVEHSLGKGEVESSILSCSTKISQLIQCLMSGLHWRVLPNTREQTRNDANLVV